MTAKITFERTGAQQARINAVIEVQAAGLDELLPRTTKAAVTRGHLQDTAQGGSGHNMLTVEQVAEVLNVGRDKIFYLLRTGQLRSIKIGKLGRISQSWLTEFIERAEAREIARSG